MNEKYKLLGSAPNYDSMLSLITGYWYGSYVKLTKVNEKEFAVSSHRGLRPELRVIIRKGRYRFERVI